MTRLENEEFQELVLKQLQSISDDIKDIRENQSRLEANQLKLENKIENEVAPRLKGLWDNQQIPLDCFKNIRENQVRMESKLETIHHSIISQKYKFQDHEQEVRKLLIGK